MILLRACRHLALWLALSLPILASAAEKPAPLDECLIQLLPTAPADMTIGQIRHHCKIQQDIKTQNEHALRRRLALEDATEFNPFVLTPYKRNYIMPFSYWSDPQAHSYLPAGEKYRHLEAKFQLSLKVPIAHWGELQFYGAFTGTFFWQSYSSDISNPFRESNYMPELFVTRPVHWQFGPVESQLLSFGFIHQSNGQDVPQSRSWNRLFFRYIFRTGDYYWSFKPWWRIPEDAKSGPMDTDGDDNPDIEHYLGHFLLSVTRVFGDQTVDIKLRNNLHRHNNAGSVQVDYTFPLYGRFKGIFQVFSGYGDSLINYNDYENRVSFGILLTDTL